MFLLFFLIVLTHTEIPLRIEERLSFSYVTQCSQIVFNLHFLHFVVLHVFHIKIKTFVQKKSN